MVPRIFITATFLALVGQLVLESPAYAQPAGQAYGGASSDGGVVSMQVNPSGTAVEWFLMEYPDATVPEGCTAWVELSDREDHLAIAGQQVSTNAPVVLEDGVVAETVDFTLTFNATGATGTWKSSAVSPSCPSRDVTFSLSPVAASVPAGPARIISGEIPRAGGIGLIVFSGGSSQQLVDASGCPAATAAFWATNADGAFVTYVPGTSVAVVNAEWNERFRSGIPANTALLGRCQ